MILDHTLGIFTHPDSEWSLIRQQRRSKLMEYLTHVPILALIPAVCFYFGVVHVGWTIAGSPKTTLTPESGLVLCVLSYLAALVGVWVFAEFINWMSRTYSDEATDQHHGMALAVYTTAPIFLASIVGIWPVLWLNVIVFVLAAAYSVYLIYEGMPIIMNIPKERAFMYATSVITVALVLLVTMRVGTVIVWSAGFGPEYVVHG
ncbi:Yip1 family protein [Saccharospirillum mangrovi]|uniref:Yip1 family protein n=1 Tax=Saccharospirillum mangrovi TaxID=2161747 RepID=UPI000D388DF5|nr:Yip1 family protein [Saccharospirillum mangrovi]